MEDKKVIQDLMDQRDQIISSLNTIAQRLDATALARFNEKLDKIDQGKNK